MQHLPELSMWEISRKTLFKVLWFNVGQNCR